MRFLTSLVYPALLAFGLSCSTENLRTLDSPAASGPSPQNQITSSVPRSETGSVLEEMVSAVSSLPSAAQGHLPEEDPTPTLTATPTPSPSPTPYAPSPTPSPYVSPVPTPSPSPFYSPTPSPTPSPSSDCSVRFEWFDNLQNYWGARFSEQTLPVLLDRYGEQLDIRFRHFPLEYMEHARKAGEAVECATDQGRRMDYIRHALEAALDSIRQETPINPDRDALLLYAQELELNLESFESCLDSGLKAEMVERDLQYGLERGVRGIPSFYISGEFIPGAQPALIFEDIIDRKLLGCVR